MYIYIISGADLENEKGGFFTCAGGGGGGRGENFAQPRPFLSQKVLLTDCIAVELANKVCCWLGLPRCLGAPRTVSWRREFARTLPCC